MYFDTHVREITADSVVIENGAGQKRLPARQVFLLTGYHPDFTFIESLGVTLDPITKKPEMDPETHESNVAGLYLAGVVIGGRHTSEIFIENGRFHGKQIVRALTGRKTQTA
jgi:thioredoxin reductase (NADPH)